MFIIRLFDLDDKNKELKSFCKKNNITYLDLSDEEHSIERVELNDNQMFIADNNKIIIGIKDGSCICKEFIEISSLNFYYIEII